MPGTVTIYETRASDETGNEALASKWASPTVSGYLHVASRMLGRPVPAGLPTAHIHSLADALNALRSAP